jgi:hypothetical protein
LVIRWRRKTCPQKLTGGVRIYHEIVHISSTPVATEGQVVNTVRWRRKPAHRK